MKKTIEYKNRYGDLISFERISDLQITMTGGKYLSCAIFPDSERLSMVDPSGGPYIGQGYNMGLIKEEWTGLIVDYATIDNGIVTFHMLGGRVFYGKTNNKSELRWYPKGKDGFISFQTLDQIIEEYGTK